MCAASAERELSKYRPADQEADPDNDALDSTAQLQRERNVTDLLPERDRPAVLARIRGAWALSDPELAGQRLELLASELDRTWPDAAGSLREGMHDTLTLLSLIHI